MNVRHIVDRTLMSAGIPLRGGEYNPIDYSKIYRDFDPGMTGFYGPLSRQLVEGRCHRILAWQRRRLSAGLRHLRQRGLFVLAALSHAYAREPDSPYRADIERAFYVLAEGLLPQGGC